MKDQDVVERINEYHETIRKWKEEGVDSPVITVSTGVLEDLLKMRCEHEDLLEKYHDFRIELASWIRKWEAAYQNGFCYDWLVKPLEAAKKFLGINEDLVPR